MATLCGGYVSVNPNYHWESDASTKSQDDCRCSTGWSGSNCEFDDCDKVLQALSLGSLFVQSDSKLQQYTTVQSKSTQSQYFVPDSVVISVKQYLRSLLATQVDLNGDGNVTALEMRSALTYRSIQNIPDNLQLWRTIAQQNSVSYKDKITLNELQSQMMANFMKPPFTFDGSDSPLVTSMTSTYPDPIWPDATCRSNDMTYISSPKVRTEWSMPSITSVTRVCGYINGILSPAFTTTDVLSGKQTFFDDINTVAAAKLNFKRIYCVSIDYCVTGVVKSDRTCPLGVAKVTSYECSIGLFYVSNEYMI